MGDKYWTGAAADGNYNTLGNWVGASKPVNDDDVWFLVGDESVTSGLDQTAVHIDELHIGGNYSGDIGSAGSPLMYETTTGEESLWMRGTGNLYVQGNWTTLWFVDAPGSTVWLGQKGSATVDTVNVVAGNVTLDIGSGAGAAIMTHLIMSYRRAVLTDADVTMSGDFTMAIGGSVRMAGGSLVMTAPLGAIDVEMANGSIDVTEVANFDQVEIYNGVISITQGIAVEGVIATLYGYGGKLVCRNAGYCELYISNAWVYPGFTLDARAVNHSVHIEDCHDFGGRVLLPCGMPVTLETE